MGKALGIVNRFYDFTNDKSRSVTQIMAELHHLVADDMEFVGPLMWTRGAAEYLVLNERLLPTHVETRMLRQFEDGDQVCSIYELVLRTPSGSTLTLPMADWIRVSNDRVVGQYIYYDPREFMAAFGV